MRSLFKSDFFLRFAGGFALGAVAVIGMQPGTLTTNLAAVAKPAIAKLA